MATLEIAYAEGRIVPVDGVTSISTEISHQGIEFLLEQHTGISHFVVGSSVEPVTIPLIVGSDEKPITLWCSQVKDTVIFTLNPILSFPFVFLSSSEKKGIPSIIKYSLRKQKQLNKLLITLVLLRGSLHIFIRTRMRNQLKKSGFSIGCEEVRNHRIQFLKQTVLLHTANLIVNTLIKDIQKSSDGRVKILYGDTDSKPMYISFSAFKTEEIKQEMNSSIKRDDI